MRKDDVIFNLRFVLPLLLCLLSGRVFAQTHEEREDTIHLSRGFMESLNNAFLFTPRVDTLRYEENPLTREQLHEWVGKDMNEGQYRETMREELGEPAAAYALTDSTDTLDTRLRDKLRYSMPNLVVAPPPSFNFAIDLSGIVVGKSKNGKYSVIRTKEGGYAVSGLDVGAALGRLFIPKDRRLYKSRKLAKENKAMMDGAFPM